MNACYSKPKSFILNILKYHIDLYLDMISTLPLHFISTAKCSSHAPYCKLYNIILIFYRMKIGLSVCDVNIITTIITLKVKYILSSMYLEHRLAGLFFPFNMCHLLFSYHLLFSFYLEED